MSLTDRELTIQETEDRYRLAGRQATSKPAIRLRGAWLREAGFEPGEQVHVRVTYQCIVIRVMEAAPDLDLD